MTNSSVIDLIDRLLQMDETHLLLGYGFTYKAKSNNVDLTVNWVSKNETN